MKKKTVWNEFFEQTVWGLLFLGVVVFFSWGITVSIALTTLPTFATFVYFFLPREIKDDGFLLFLAGMGIMAGWIWGVSLSKTFDTSTLLLSATPLLVLFLAVNMKWLASVIQEKRRLERITVR